jgi:hypothetical protein
MNKYESQLFAWAVDRIIAAKLDGIATTEAVIAEAKKLVTASYSAERAFESVVEELAALFKVISDPAEKAHQLVLELNHMLEDIERQQAEKAAYNTEAA